MLTVIVTYSVFLDDSNNRMEISTIQNEIRTQFSFYSWNYDAIAKVKGFQQNEELHTHTHTHTQQQLCNKYSWLLFVL